MVLHQHAPIPLSLCLMKKMDGLKELLMGDDVTQDPLSAHGFNPTSFHASLFPTAGSVYIPLVPRARGRRRKKKKKNRTNFLPSYISVRVSRAEASGLMKSACRRKGHIRKSLAAGPGVRSAEEPEIVLAAN